MRSKRASDNRHYEIPAQCFAGSPGARAWTPAVPGDDEADLVAAASPGAMTRSSRMHGASRHATAGRATLSEPMC